MQESGFIDFDTKKLLSNLNDISVSLKSINKEISNLNLTINRLFGNTNNNSEEMKGENDEEE